MERSITAGRIRPSFLSECHDWLSGCQQQSGQRPGGGILRIAAPLDWEGECPEAFTTLVLKREDNRWKVDSYNFPEASYPEEFTITEEIRVKLTDGTKETTLSDAAEKEQIVARLRELTLGTVVQEAPAQDCIAIEAVDNGAVYHMSVAPDGRVWDTLLRRWGVGSLPGRSLLLSGASEPSGVKSVKTSRDFTRLVFCCAELSAPEEQSSCSQMVSYRRPVRAKRKRHPCGCLLSEVFSVGLQAAAVHLSFAGSSSPAVSG